MIKNINKTADDKKKNNWKFKVTVFRYFSKVCFSDTFQKYGFYAHSEGATR